MRVLIIDNYDSFTFNIVQMIGEKTGSVLIIRDDEYEIGRIKEFNPDGIIISPGPGRPEQATASKDVIKNFSGKVPILGICLGHQIIASHYNAEIVPSPVPKHGKISRIKHDGNTIFQCLPAQLNVMRYHSLQIKYNTFPSEFIISATSDDNVIMGLRHKFYKLEGVQFHPESVMTEYGDKMISNWLSDLS